jgi:hypothetical protein
MQTKIRIIIEKHANYGGGAIQSESDISRIYHIKEVVGSLHPQVNGWLNEREVQRLLEDSRRNQVVIRAAK